MAFTDAFRTPQLKAQREADLAAMRERWRRDPPRFRERSEVVTKQEPVVRHKARPIQARDLAHAIRIAIKDAQMRNGNPMYIEALEIAASYFDDFEP